MTSVKNSDEKYDICRLCREQSTNTLLFSENNIAEMLENLTSIKTDADDKCSKKLCYTCYQQLGAAYSIKKKFLEYELRNQQEDFSQYLIDNHDELMKVIQNGMSNMNLASNSSTLPEQIQEIVEEAPIRYSCKLCSITFEVSADLLQHVQKHIDDIAAERRVLCDQCGEVCKDEHEYDAHKNSVHVIVMQKCTGCTASFLTVEELKEHIKQTHSRRKPFVCDFCFQVFNFHHNYGLHRDRHINGQPYLCKICDFDLVYEVSFRYHQISTHGAPEDPKLVEMLNIPKKPVINYAALGRKGLLK